jgi:FtsP/CotA-like multicopper oxidase with cupredoxin domain
MSLSRSRVSPPLVAVAIAASLLIAASPVSAQTVEGGVTGIEPTEYSGGPGVGPIGPPQTRNAAIPSPGAGAAPKGPTGSASAGSGGDPFFRIQKTIVMKEEEKTLPMPVYESVDVEGAFKNAPNSVACGGTVSEGVAEDADDCQQLYQLTFADGYLQTSGTITTPNATTYNGDTSLLIVGHVGDVVQLTVKNELPEAINDEAIGTGFFAPADNKQIVHWHGMELDNESDGTPVAEFGIETGEQRLYQYRLYRPGVYWFHPHVLPLLTESRGMVGRLVIRSYEEDFLSLIGVLPLTQHVFQLKDSTIANEFNKDAYRNGTLFEDFFTPEEVENNLMPDISPDLNGDGVCDRGPGDCVVKEGEYVFVNGVVPTSDENIPTIYVREGGGARVAFINSSVERFWRFRLLLEGEEPPGASGTPVPAERTGRATTGQCYAGVGQPKFSGVDPLSCDQGLIMYRVGGQNGLLDHARVEGQAELAPGEPARPFDTVIRRGEDFIGVSERTEFVVVTKDREGNYLEPGESMFIWTIDYPHGIFTPAFDNNIGDGDANNRDIAPRKLVRIKIVPNFFHLPNYNLAEGTPLMAHPWVNRPTENIKTAVLNQLSPVPLGLDPFLGVPFEGLEHGNIMLGNQVNDGSRFPSINSVKGAYMGDDVAGDQVPTQGATRYARTEDVIEFVYANNTGAAHHPFHMHGFSFQPISIHRFQNVDSNSDGINDTITLNEPPLHVFTHNEFIDVEVMQPATALKYRMKMNDRYKIPDETKFSWSQLLSKFPYDYHSNWGGSGDLIGTTSAESGGALGRWLFHCHILHHADMGMMSDLCIASKDDTDASACKIDVDQDIYQPIP